VWLGDNSYITAHGIGHIPVHMRAKNKWNRVILQDVLYVPELHGNLLSVSALAKRGARVQFFDHRCEILDKDGTLTCVGHLDNSLYVVDARTSISDSARLTHVDVFPSEGDDIPTDDDATAAYTARSQISTADVRTWHRRLGHISADSVLRMVQKGMVTGMAITGDASRDAIGLCEPCIMGKHTRRDIEKHTHVRANVILGRIFSDLCGPMQTRSREGYHFLRPSSTTNLAMPSYAVSRSRAISMIVSPTSSPALNSRPTHTSRLSALMEEVNTPASAHNNICANAA